VGFSPVGQVFGAAVYAAGSASASTCPGALASAGTGIPVAGDPDGFAPLVEAMYQARRTALDRMTAECAALGGHGVVGVRLSSGTYSFGELEIMAIGTAVRGAGAGGLPVPFTSAVSGQGFARLIKAGWVPAGLALGLAIGARHDDLAISRQARPWSGNAEISGWTELVNQTRQDARRHLDRDVRRLGAEGVVTADMRMGVRVRDCPAAVGRHDHVVEVTLLGTAIVGFAAAGHRRAAPALAIMPLGPRRPQPFWARR
jgi:uncharacterized protein YbjQ (UPF0145 family)